MKEYLEKLQEALEEKNKTTKVEILSMFSITIVIFILVLAMVGCGELPILGQITCEKTNSVGETLVYKVTLWENQQKQIITSVDSFESNVISRPGDMFFDTDFTRNFLQLGGVGWTFSNPSRDFFINERQAESELGELVIFDSVDDCVIEDNR